MVSIPSAKVVLGYTSSEHRWTLDKSVLDLKEASAIDFDKASKPLTCVLYS
jgi:hypothetical protein